MENPRTRIRLKLWDDLRGSLQDILSALLCWTWPSLLFPLCKGLWFLSASFQYQKEGARSHFLSTLASAPASSRGSLLGSRSCSPVFPSSTYWPWSILKKEWMGAWRQSSCLRKAPVTHRRGSGLITLLGRQLTRLEGAVSVLYKLGTFIWPVMVQGAVWNLLLYVSDFKRG